MNAIEWLSQRAPGFGKLEHHERAAVADFALLWSFFESRCLRDRGGVPGLRKYVKALSDEVIDDIEIDETVEYFRGRYVDGENFSTRYQDLHLEKSGNPREVIRMLRCESEAKHENIVGCLSIIYRLRNNLFHGTKWAYGITEQDENFNRSCRLLMGLMRDDT